MIKFSLISGQLNLSSVTLFFMCLYIIHCHSVSDSICLIICLRISPCGNRHYRYIKASFCWMCFHKFTAYYISNFVNCLYPWPIYHLLNDFLIRGLQKLFILFYFVSLLTAWWVFVTGICFPHSFPFLCWFWGINEVKFYIFM